MQTNLKVARENNNGVAAYLASLVWDGTPRLDRWLIDSARAEDSPYVREISRGMLVAAVRRALHPGCWFDRMPIIERPQGIDTLPALRVLAAEDAWCTDEFPLDAQGLVKATAGKWIVVVSDLGARGRSYLAALKECLSRRYDVLHGERGVTLVPRQFMVIRTANEAEGFLNDQPGNRRFMPVRIQGFDLDRLWAMRDQLWAEATAVEDAEWKRRIPSE